MKLVRNREVWSGLLMIAIGALAVYSVRNNSFGTLSAMGSAYLPTALGVILAMLGLGIVATGLAGQAAGVALDWRAVPVIASIVFFAFALRPLGMVIAVGGTVVIATLSVSVLRRFEVALLAAGLAAFCSLVFVKFLGINIGVWPS